MELTIAYFPILKIGILLMIGGITLYINKKGYKNTSYFMMFIIIVLSLFTPFKYDGTNRVETQKIQIQQRTSRYDDVVNNSVKLEVKKLTFQERMKLESQRSKEANNKVEVMIDE